MCSDGLLGAQLLELVEVGDSGIVHSKLDVLVSQPPERSHDVGERRHEAMQVVEAHAEEALELAFVGWHRDALDDVELLGVRVHAVLIDDVAEPGRSGLKEVALAQIDLLASTVKACEGVEQHGHVCTGVDHDVVDVGKQLVAVQGTSRGFWGVTQATGGAGRVILTRLVEDLYLAAVELLAGHS